METAKKLLTTSGLICFLVVLCIETHKESDYHESIFEETHEEVSTIITKEKQAGNLSEPKSYPISKTDCITKEEIKENTLSWEDEVLLMRIAQAEAGNQGPQGMWLVMSVVMNRVAAEEYPDTIEGVILQPHQFSSVDDGHFDDQVVLGQEAFEALERIEQGDIAPELVAFENINSNVLDQYYWEAFTYRDHRFYTRKSD